jgi:hypothetical protein
MLDTLQKTLNRNLLKYSAGHHIFCPICDKIADYRSWVIWESPSRGVSRACCAECFDAAQGDKPLPEGWAIIREGKPKAPKRQGFPTGKKALDSALRKDIHNAHKRLGNCAKVDRIFPLGFGDANWPMVETVSDDGTVSIDYQGDPHYSAYQIAEYVRQYCKANHLIEG